MKSVIEVVKTFIVFIFLLWALKFLHQAQEVRSVPSGHAQSVEQEQKDGIKGLGTSPRATEPVKGSPLSLLSLLGDHRNSPSDSCKVQKGTGIL